MASSATIVPWNYPILLMAWKVAPALAAGNTVVIKPSEMTPLSTLAFAEIFDHLPPGVVNIVTGYGREAGEALVLDPRVRVVAFTGSLETGRRIAPCRRRADQEAAPGAGWQRRLHRRRGRRPGCRRSWRGLGGAAQRRAGLHLHRARLRPREHRPALSSSASSRMRAGCGLGLAWIPKPMSARWSATPIAPRLRRMSRMRAAHGARVLTGGRGQPRSDAASSTSRRC